MAYSAGIIAENTPCTPPADVTQLIGNTPLLHLKRSRSRPAAPFSAKPNSSIPGGSVKDRTALGIIRAAEASGELQPGGRIVEGTAGNTGIGLTLLANALGYRSSVVMPITQSKEKIDSLELLGADLHLVGATSYKDPNHYIHTAERLAEKYGRREEQGAIWARQFDNLANMEIHRDTTGAEIWEQTDGKVDGFVCAVGTGGTLAGVSIALKERNPDISIGMADPLGASLYSTSTAATLQPSAGSSIVEGIGINHVTDNVAQARVDSRLRSQRRGSTARHIFDCCRTRACAWVALPASISRVPCALPRQLGPGHTIVTILCDYGNRYQSKLFNPVFLENKGLPVPEWLAI